MQADDAPPLDDDGTDHVCDDEHRVLESRERGETRSNEESELPGSRRLVDCTNTCGNRCQDERIRDEIGNCERREREGRDEERVGRAKEGVRAPDPEPAGEVIGDERGKRPDDGVLDLDGVVRGRRRKGAPEWCRQDRLEDLGEVSGAAADLEVTMGDRPPERRVDVLVREVARGLVQDRQERVNCGRDGDEGGEREPGPPVANVNR